MRSTVLYTSGFLDYARNDIMYRIEIVCSTKKSQAKTLGFFGAENET